MKHVNIAPERRCLINTPPMFNMDADLKRKRLLIRMVRLGGGIENYGKDAKIIQIACIKFKKKI